MSLLAGELSTLLVVRRGVVDRGVSAGCSVVVIKRPGCLMSGSVCLSWLCVLVGFEFFDLLSGG